MTKILLLSLIFIFALTCVAFAQDATEEITAQDLEISEPKVLPDSIFYPLKSLKRNFYSFFTRDPVKKAELKLKFADEKLIEAKLLAQKTDKPELIIKATENYEQEIKKIKITREKHLQRFGEVMQKLEDKEKIPERLDKPVKTH